MSYNTESLARLADLKALAERVESENMLKGVKVNGTALAIADKIVDILIKTGSTDGTISANGVDVNIKGLAAMAYKANVTESDLDSALLTAINGKAAATSVYTKSEVDAKISAVYKPAGSVAFASLPVPSADVLGNVYNVSDAFTTSVSFVEGDGIEYPAGTNVVVVSTATDVYRYDVLSGFVDTSGFVEKEAGKGLSANDYTTVEKQKLANLSNYAHPTYTAKANGLYKVTVDATGHVSATVNITKSDITGLGIPGENTTYSEATATAAGLMSAEDKAKLNGMEIATDTEVTEMLEEVFTAE